MIGKLVLGKVLKPVLWLLSDTIGLLSMLYEKVGANPVWSEHVKLKALINHVLNSPQVKLNSLSEHVMTALPCDQRSKNKGHQSLLVSLVLLLVAAVLAVISGAPSVHAATSSSDEEEDDQEGADNKKKIYLWCSGDSCGYTRGIPNHIYCGIY